jgi:hypothetical protein
MFQTRTRSHNSQQHFGALNAQNWVILVDFYAQNHYGFFVLSNMKYYTKILVNRLMFRLIATDFKIVAQQTQIVCPGNFQTFFHNFRTAFVSVSKIKKTLIL